MDKENSEPLIGVNIVVQGTVLGTVTDLDGKFFLSVQAALQFVLAVSSIGYNSQEIEINDDNIMDLEIIFWKKPLRLVERWWFLLLESRSEFLNLQCQ